MMSKAGLANQCGDTRVLRQHVWSRQEGHVGVMKREGVGKGEGGK